MRAMPRRFPYAWTEVALAVVLAVQCSRLIWTALAPLGPVGNWRGGPVRELGSSVVTLKAFDPFFRMSAPSGAAVVTSLPLKLFGVRVDQATGRGSAIIATPDGVQQSFAVGDEVMPGIRLKAVANDSVTIDRGGVAEQLYLDQSVSAAVADTDTAGATSPAIPSVAELRVGISFAPKLEKGVVTGFTIEPRGAGEAFRAAGFLPGDIVTQINGTGFGSVQEASAAVASLPVGTPVSFAVERAGRTTTLSTRFGQ